MNRQTTTMKSPVGTLTLIADNKGLNAILWEKEKPHRVPLQATAEKKENPIFENAKKQLQEYFEGRRQKFNLPLSLAGTAFQKEVWQALAEIPFGEVRTYGEMAAKIGRPKAQRAVGAAIGRNPVSIVVPCHRVIGSDGSLTGFAAGLQTKSFLLRHENAPVKGLTE